MYDEIAMRVLRENLRCAMALVEHGDHRLMILRNGKAVAGLVAPHELRAIDKVESCRIEHHEMMVDQKLNEFRALKKRLDAEKLAQKLT